MFDDIPDGCVAHILEHLLSVHDVFNFQRTCSRFARIGRTHQATWLSWLRKDFDIRLEVRWSPLLFLAPTGTVAEVIRLYKSGNTEFLSQATAALDGQELYRQTSTAGVRKLRYKGCFTDGGIDEGRVQYWVKALPQSSGSLTAQSTGKQ